MFKKHNFSNTVHYCSSSMPRLSQMPCFLKSPSFQQVQSALIGQLTQCIVIGRTPQARVGNVTPLSIIAIASAFKLVYQYMPERGTELRDRHSDDACMYLQYTTQHLFCISDSVTLSNLNELNLYPVFWVTLRISLYIRAAQYFAC